MSLPAKGLQAQPALAAGDFQSADARDMIRMGRVQQLKRYFGPWGLMGFASVTGAVWQYVLLTLLWSFPNGGASGAFYMYIVCAIGLMLNTLSLAEMASLAPTAGSQYHWISEFAPRNAQKMLSYVVGWLVLMGWQVGLASVCYLTALQIQSFAIMHHPDFAFQNWHGSLMTIAIALVAVFFNTVLVRVLPHLEFIMLVLHFAAFFAFVFVLGFMGPSADSSQVFNNWENSNGWSETSTAVLVGIIAPVTTLTSADSICHLAEELRDASKWLPRIMVLAAATNFSIGFILLVLILFRAGNVEAAIASPTGQPYVAILLNATGSVAGTSVLVAYIILALVFCATNVVTTSSRQLFAFARDGGVPFSKWLAQVSSKKHVPAQAIICTISVTVLLSLILIGSSTAFNIIASLFGVALMGSYIVSIGTLVYQRLTAGHLPRTRFSLGRAGIYVNFVTIAFDAFVFVMMFFPPAPHPGAASMNWACLIFGAVTIFALGFYAVSRRHVSTSFGVSNAGDSLLFQVYTAPVESVRREEDLADMGMEDGIRGKGVTVIH